MSFTPGVMDVTQFLDGFMEDRLRKRCVNDGIDFGQDVDNAENDVPLQDLYNTGLSVGMQGLERKHMGLEGNPEALNLRPAVQRADAIARYPGSAMEQMENAYPGGVGFANSAQAVQGDFLNTEGPHGNQQYNANMGRTGSIPSITEANRPGTTNYIPTVEQAVRTAGANPLPQGLGMSNLGQPNDEMILASLKRRGIRR